MISVLTLTYQRHYLLEEAIFSFLSQTELNGFEMVVINDSPIVEYEFDHPNVRIVNVKERFSSIGKKLEFGYKQCNNEFVYRLDDDDLLAPWAMEDTANDVRSHSDFDVYRSSGHYYFENNKYVRVMDNINNGNVYSKSFLDRITFPEKSGDEDVYITFHNGARIYTANRKRKTMLYRWGMGTYHISGWGIAPSSKILDNTDTLVSKIARDRGRSIETGRIVLIPAFSKDYYSEIE